MNELHSLYNANVIIEHPSLKINKKTCKKDKVSYEIWNYDNNYISFDEKQDTLLCRSVVFSYPEQKLLAYSPGKTIQSKKFCNKYTDQNQIYINEYIDCHSWCRGHNYCQRYGFERGRNEY